MVRHVEVSPEVKAAIVDTLRSSNGTLSKGTAALGESRVGGDILWACQGQGTSDVILVWHIATGILEARHGAASSTNSRSAGNRAVVATHLSRYCAYLVAAAPELLPDDKAWSKKLHETVSRDIKLALAETTSSLLEHDGAIAVRLGERSEHEVVKGRGWGSSWWSWFQMRRVSWPASGARSCCTPRPLTTSRRTRRRSPMVPSW
jgi:hypothetical protein